MILKSPICFSKIGKAKMTRPNTLRESHLGEHVRAYSKRSSIHHASEKYGKSVSGIQLEYWSAHTGKTQLLLFAGIHGEEPESTVLLSRALRTFREPSDYCSVILAANPDGLRNEMNYAKHYLRSP